MATQKETVEFILEQLGEPLVFSARAMFGEYALYANTKVVALICDDILYVKILPVSEVLQSQCEKGYPYPGAKLHYIISEDQLFHMPILSKLLKDIAGSLPAKKLKK